ncbi:MAG TPA: cbb3-type cytochrome c oxidase subunit I, partial [Candidatus Dormibacteraeota bacterium]
MATVTAPPPQVVPESYERSMFAPVTTWLTTTDHKLIGIMYMVTSFMAFLVAGVFALIIRVQLAQPNMNVVDAETYNQLVSAHGTTMIFFFVTLFLTGIANYIVPIMVGA